VNYTLITGASSGIGQELARVFAKNNHNLVLVARSKEKLEELKKEIETNSEVVAEVISIDLSVPKAAEVLYEEVKKKNLHVDILVNNAGFGDHGLFADSDPKRNDDMIVLNILTLTKLTRLFMTEMIRLKHGRILNVASTAAFQPGPLMSVYYATKAYVLSFSEALHEELIGTDVSVTALCPGPTESGFQAAANMNDVPLFEAMAVPTSLEVAEYGYEALMNKQVVAIHGLLNVIAAKTTAFVPRIILRKLVKRLQSKRIASR
jgi:uncharacterized protein